MGVVGVAGAGGVVGVIAGGSIADGLLARGRRDARIVVPALAFFAVVVVFVPAVLVTTVVVATPLLIVTGFFLAMANPPLDAARLDVVPAALWGRAESVRSTLRSGLEALAPLVFGLTAQHLFGGGDHGLEAAMLVMVVPLAASPAVLLLARRSYPVDVATAAETDRLWKARQDPDRMRPTSAT